jgi:transcriptional regulator with XRE-family HTH domain
MKNGRADIDLWVARRLKQLRAERGITLTALAEQTGISAAHLSRLEKGDRQPSIGSLLQISRVYGVSVSELVQDQDEEEYHLVRAGEATRHPGQDGVYTVLSGSGAAIAVVRVELPGGRRTKEAKHIGEEWLHVLSGVIELALAGQEIRLSAGDSVHFDSGRPHRLTNTSEDSATVLIASTAATMPMHHPVPALEAR